MGLAVVVALSTGCVLALAASTGGPSGADATAATAHSTAPGAPVNLAPPMVVVKVPAGVLKGELTCFMGLWKEKPMSLKPTSFMVKWLRDGSEIAAGPTYVLKPGDHAHYFACQVIASNAAGSTTVTSPAFPVPPSDLGPLAFPDHFKCYRVSVERNQPHGLVVSLRDQFGAVRAEVERAITLCNPVSKDRGGIREPYAHLVCYQTNDTTPLTQQPRVAIVNQFGIENALVQNPESLCVPSLKRELAPGGTGQPPRGPDPQKVLDHYRCYRVIPTTQAQPTHLVMLQDQFETTLTRAARLVQLCTPVSKNNRPILQAAEHLACYLIEGRQPEVVRGNVIGVFAEKVHDVIVTNQFGTDQLRVFKPLTLCVPSLKVVLTTTTTTTTQTTPTTRTTTSSTTTTTSTCRPSTQHCTTSTTTTHSTTSTTSSTTAPTCTASLSNQAGGNQVNLAAQCDKALDSTPKTWKFVAPPTFQIGAFTWQGHPGACGTTTTTTANDTEVCQGGNPAATPINAQITLNQALPSGSGALCVFGVFVSGTEYDFHPSGP